MAKSLIERKNKTRNCNIKRDKGYDVYCGRGKDGQVPDKIGEYGWLGNPIKVGETCEVCNDTHKTKGETLYCYNDYLDYKLTNKKFAKEFYKLKGKKLGCFCKPYPCHTDIMIKYL